MSRRILVVDDEYDLLHAICGFLEDEGYDVRPCGSGEEALSILRDEELPDLVLMDVMMPGISGVEVAQRIAQTDKGRKVPVVMMSAAAAPEATKTPAWKAFLRKPFEIDKLIETVDRFARR